jgi:integrase
MKLRLTDLAIKKLTHPKVGQKSYWDETTPGFGLRCSAKSKSFVVMYGEKRRLKTLGRYPNLSLAVARAAAKKELVAVGELTFLSQEVELEQVVSLYLSECEGRLRPSTVSEYRRYLKAIQFKGNISEWSRAHITKELGVWSHSPSGHNHAFTAIKVFLNWAMQKEMIATNPLGPLKRPHSQLSRDTVLSDDQLSRILRHTVENRSRYNDIIALLIFTGQRRGEIAGLRWSEINGNLLSLSPNRTKNKKRHTFPLGRMAMELIETCEGSEHYVFGRIAEDVPFSGWSKAKKRLDMELGLEEFTLHDLRRTFATKHAKIGTPIHVTEKLLNHVSGTISGVAAVYNRHSYMEEMRAAMAAYDQYLEKILNP